jgi:hypothetical protein
MRRRPILPTRLARTQAKKRYFRRKNRKEKYCDPATGLNPFVLLIKASGKVYPEAEPFVAQISVELQQKRQERQRAIARSANNRWVSGNNTSRTIDDFRSDGRYGGDGNRIDLAYAVYALSHGAGVADVEAAMRTRDLSHKGNERRQDDYVARTIRKAMAALEGQVDGRSR